MQIKIFQNYQTLSEAAATMIMDFVKKKPNALLCFATGDSPRLTYKILTEKAKEQHIDFSKCLIVGLDEWLGIAPDKPGSCHHFLHNYLFEPLSIDPAQVFLFDSMTTNEQEECERINRIMEEKGPIDFMLVGVGMNGHIGFNEPGTDIDSKAHVSVLDDTTRTVGKKYFLEEVSIRKGMTLGLKQVMQAQTLLMMANGKKKAPVINQALEKEISNSFPASLIRQHKQGILMIDIEAASELEKSNL